MYDWIIESLMVGCQKLHRMRSRPRSLSMQSLGDKAGGAAEADRETVEAGGTLCGAGCADGYYIVFDK